MKFPKSARLLKSREFSRLYQVKNKNRFCSDFFYLDYRFSPSEQPKLGISASKKFGKAHERNYFKRLIREAFRSQLSSFPPVEINVIPKSQAKAASLEDLKKELLHFKEALTHVPVEA